MTSKSNTKFYITTPIYYVNDIPHIGHAYTTIVSDVLARYYRQKGDEVFFLTGTDEHGAKIAQAAGLKNKNPKEFCDELVPKFQNTWKNLGVEYDYFIRTSNKKHEKIVQDVLTTIYKKGDIYKHSYDGLYCVACEKMLTKSELIDGKCPIHKTKPVKISEENYFFKLSKYRDKLLVLIENGKLKILPKERKNEIVSKLKLGLDDISISRKEVTWGVPIPWDESQTIYVWIDALLNYYSGPKIGPKHDHWFPADLHLMAKDISWFHAVIWPALCLSAGLELPKTVFAHGFFTVAGEKMSKTTGNVIDPNKWVKKYGADAVRYYLLTAFPFGEDGDVSEEKLEAKYNSDLANELGNLVNRVVTMMNRYKISRNKISLEHTRDRQDTNKSQSASWRTNSKISKLIEEFKFDEALKEIWKKIKQLNQSIEENKPWELARSTSSGQAKTDKKKLEKFLLDLSEKLHVTCYMLHAFLPATAAKIESQLKTLHAEPLFPRIKELS